MAIGGWLAVVVGILLVELSKVVVGDWPTNITESGVRKLADELSNL